MPRRDPMAVAWYSLVFGWVYRDGYLERAWLCTISTNTWNWRAWRTLADCGDRGPCGSDQVLRCRNRKCQDVAPVNFTDNLAFLLVHSRAYDADTIVWTVSPVCFCKRGRRLISPT